MKILITLLFKNSALWIERFLSCLDSLLGNLENREKGITYDLSILYGTFTDDTVTLLKNYVNNLNRQEFTQIVNTYDKLLNIPRRLDNLEKLSALRNVSIYRMEHVDVMKHVDKIDENRLKNYDYIFQIDTDTLFDVATCTKLIDDISNDCQIGVIAPMVFIEKSHPDSENIFYDTFAFRYFSGNNADDEKNGEMFKIREPYFLLNENEKKSEIHEVYSVGTFYICRADIFWKYGIKYSTEERKNLDLHPQRKLESEQVVFCRNVRRYSKYGIYVDRSVNIYHIDLPKYGMEWH